MEYAPGDGMLAYTEAGDMKLDLRMLMFVFFSFSIFASLEPISDSAHVLGVIDEAEDTEHTYRHEQPDSHADGHEQDAAFDMRHGLSQNLQVRLRNSNGKAEQEADTENQRHILCSGQRRANLAADGRHGLLCAEGKQPHSNDQHHRAYQKAQQQIGAHRRDHEAQQKHYDRDGQHRQRGFNDFLFDCGSVYFQLS